ESSTIGLQNPPYTYLRSEKTVPVADWDSKDIYSTVDACRMHVNVESHESSYFNLDQNGKEPATVTEDDEMSKEKEIDKLMALISLSFKKIYKPTNNNLQTSSNTSRANQDNSPRINRGTGYDNQRVVNIAGARENIGTQVVQKFGIQCYNCKEYGHVSRECQKPKRVKDAAYYKEKMLLCKQEEAEVQLNAEQADWKDDTDDESDDQELEAHYMWHKFKRCSKHMTGNLKLLTNFVEKFLGTVKFGNDQIALIFVAFPKSTCHIRDLKGNDLLTGSRGTDLYSITLQDSPTPNPICLMAKATSSQARLWPRCLSLLNFDSINLLSKNNIVNGLPKLKFVKDHLCSSYILRLTSLDQKMKHLKFSLISSHLSKEDFMVKLEQFELPKARNF
ncbi:retrovirus-related pol polyprotein from transposon TNT 1-94, partial [Tanacetum coccineum]